MRSVPPYARGGTRSNGGATWAMRSERVMGRNTIREKIGREGPPGGILTASVALPADCRVGLGQ